MFLKKVEKESLFKSFLLFFISQIVLVSALFFMNYKQELKRLDEQIFSQMRVCSFDLKCKEFHIDFTPKGDYQLYKLYKDGNEIRAYFNIIKSQKYNLKISLTKKSYLKKKKKLEKKIIIIFLIISLIVAFLSSLFALYTLSPLRNALQLTEEFIKDILHDFNTPLSTLRLNIAMLQYEKSEMKKVKRIQNAIQNILNLQTNLRFFLNSHSYQKEKFSLNKLVQERVELISSNYKDVKFLIEGSDIELYTNKNSFIRIIDNLLSNGGKYNIKNGTVFIKIIDYNLIIKDSGKGIQNPSKVFQRFYKEQERGIGIGLHIVQKLSQELEIDISLTSQLKVGTTFTLNLKKICS